MADPIPDFPGSDPFESNGQAISRSLASGRSGRAVPSVTQDFRNRQQTAKEQDATWRKDITERKFEVEKMAAQSAREAASLKAAELKFNLVEKQSAMRQKQEELTHSTSVMEELNGLDWKDGATPNRIADIYRRNPRALDNPRVAAFADRILGMHETFLKDFRTDAQTDIERLAAKDAEAAAVKAGLNPTDVTTKVGSTTTKFEAPKTTVDATAKDDAAHLSRLESLRMRPSLSKSLGQTDDKGKPTREAQDAQDQVNYLDEQIQTVKGRLSTPSATPATTTVVPAADVTQLKAAGDDILKAARAAIAGGKDAAAVAKRLQDNGYDPSGL